MAQVKVDNSPVRIILALFALALGTLTSARSLSLSKDPLPAKAYPLNHFLEYEEDRVRGSSSFCLGCPKLDGSKLTLEDYEIVTEQRTLNPTLGSRVIEIHTRFSPTSKVRLKLPVGGVSPDGQNYFVPNGVQWKVILTETTANLFREIYRFEAENGEMDGPPVWAQLLHQDRETILTSNDPLGGNGGSCQDGYWTIDASGAHPIDFSLVDKAMALRTPKGSQLTQTRCWALDMSTQTIHTYAQKPNSCHACGYTAEVVAHFHLQGSAAVPDHVEATLSDDDN